MSAEGAWLDYRVRWRSGEARPGRHGSRRTGQAGALRGFRPFWQVPDARAIDVRRSLLDPAGDIVVRQTEDRGSITLVIAADVSRSMRPREDTTKLDAVATLLVAAARAAHRAGDRLGFLAFDDGIRADLTLAPTRARSAAADLAARLRALRPAGRGAEGMRQLAAHLPERRCLVLLISDFFVPAETLRASLLVLARHDVAPLVLHDAAEAALPARGLLRLEDAETGARRLIWMRPRLAARLRAAGAARRRALDAAFRDCGRGAFHIEGALDLDALGWFLCRNETAGAVP